MDTIQVEGIHKRFGSVDVLEAVSLRVESGSVLALLGPSGCGKTTLLRIIAGLETPDAGTVTVGDRLLTGPGTSVPPERRRIGMVFQDWALFPHLTVAGNIAYGLGRENREHRVGKALELVGLSGLGPRLPGTLSGGQQQRVALARALAPEPSVLLLDEPFSNLDTSLRVQVRTEVHRLLDDLSVTSVFVTHDQDEAFILGDEVAVMSGGQIVQQDTPAGLYSAPASPWVASFVGDANLLDGDAAGDAVSTALGTVPLADTFRGPAIVLLRPEELHVGPPGNGGAAAVVESIEYFGHDCVYALRLTGGAAVRVRVGSVPRHARGDAVSVNYQGPPAVAWPAASLSPAE